MASAANLLAQLNETIEALDNSGVSSYSIGNRTVTKIDVTALLKARRELLHDVQRETGSGGISLGKLTRHRR